MIPVNHVAYTAPVNPPSATPVLTIEHVWPLLRRKIRRAQEFVPAAISDCRVVAETTTTHAGVPGYPLVTREVTFVEGGRRVREDCLELFPTRVDFRQPDGSVIQNIVSEGPGGELFMTYVFEWGHGELAKDEAALNARLETEKKMAKLAVEGTLEAMREMVRDGRWKEEI